MTGDVDSTGKWRQGNAACVGGRRGSRGRKERKGERMSVRSRKCDKRCESLS